MTPGDVTDGAPPPAADEVAVVAGGMRPHAASGGRWGALDQLVQAVVRLVAAVVLSRLLDPREFGLMAMATVVLNLVSLGVGLGVSEALIPRRQVDRRVTGVAFTVTLGSGVILAGLTAAAAPLLARLFDEPRLTGVLVASSVLFLVVGMERTPSDLLVRALRFRDYHLSSTAGTVVGAVAGIGLAVADAGVWALVGMLLTEATVAGFLGWTFARRAGIWTPSVAVEAGLARELVGFGGYVTAARVVAYGRSNGDNFIVGRALGATDLGYYALAFRTMLAPIAKVSVVVGATALATFSAVRDEVERLRAGLAEATRYVALVCFPISIGVAVAAPLLVPVVFGDRWEPAVPVVQILALTGPYLAVTSLDDALFRATNRPHWSFRLALLDTGIAIPAFLVGAQHGIEGVAVAVVVASCLMAPAALWARGRALGLSILDQLRPVAPVAAATLVMAAVATGVREVAEDRMSAALALAAVAATGALAYAAALAVFAPGLLRRFTADLFRRTPQG